MRTRQRVVKKEEEGKKIHTLAHFLFPYFSLWHALVRGRQDTQDFSPFLQGTTYVYSTAKRTCLRNTLFPGKEIPLFINSDANLQVPLLSWLGKLWVATRASKFLTRTTTTTLFHSMTCCRLFFCIQEAFPYACPIPHAANIPLSRADDEEAEGRKP